MYLFGSATFRRTTQPCPQHSRRHTMSMGVQREPIRNSVETDYRPTRFRQSRQTSKSVRRKRFAVYANTAEEKEVDLETAADFFAELVLSKIEKQKRDTKEPVKISVPDLFHVNNN